MVSQAPPRVPVTIAVVRRARPGCERDLEAWMRDAIAVATRFPGNLASTVMRPSAPGQDWVLVSRYASQDDLERWRNSAELGGLLARVEPLSEPVRVTEREGLEPFFELPTGAPPPPRWKMALTSWLAIYPLVVLLSYGLAPLLGAAPIPVRALALTAILIPLMTWLVMPVLTRLLRPWLASS